MTQLATAVVFRRETESPGIDLSCEPVCHRYASFRLYAGIGLHLAFLNYFAGHLLGSLRTFIFPS